MRILCLPYTHTLSHISRPLAVAIELRRRGHGVIFAGDSPKDHFIRSQGFEVLPAYQVAPELLFERIRQGKLQFVLVEELDRMISADHDLYRKVKPDLVLSDGRFSAPISTGIDRLEHAAIVNVSSTAYRALPYLPFFDWLPGSQGDRSSLFWQTLDRINLFVEMQVFDFATGIFKKLSREHELPHMVTATNCLAGKDLTLLADLEAYFPTRNLPADYHYIGPLTWESPLPAPEWWPPEKTGNLLVYFTMGTTWVGGSFAALYKMIRTHGITAILSTGGQARDSETEGLKNINGEIYVEAFVDGRLVVEACDVVVCHGGNGTIYQALQQGKPIIGIPTIPDQEFNMRRVKALGVGEKLPLKKLARSPEKLFQLVRHVANTPSYSQKAQQLKKILAELKPAEHAADLIEKFFGKK